MLRVITLWDRDHVRTETVSFPRIVLTGIIIVRREVYGLRFLSLVHRDSRLRN